MSGFFAARAVVDKGSISIRGCVRPVIGCDAGGEEVVVVYAAAVVGRYVSLDAVGIWLAGKVDVAQGKSISLPAPEVVDGDRVRVAGEAIHNAVVIADIHPWGDGGAVLRPVEGEACTGKLNDMQVIEVEVCYDYIVNGKDVIVYYA
jgi:hypothetical protein